MASLRLTLITVFDISVQTRFFSILPHSHPRKQETQLSQTGRSRHHINGIQYLQRTYTMLDLEIFKIAEMTFSVIQGHW